MKKTGLFVLLLLILVSCTPSLPEMSPVSPVVTFDVQGKGEAPASQSLTLNSKAVKPADPSCEGYKFTGWYTDKNCTEQWDFDNPVSNNMTLYAGWSQLAGGVTVSFKMNGHGTAPASQTVIEGDTITEPVTPVAAGYVFMGWFSDMYCETAWDFNTPVTAAKTLYAGWGMTVSFNMNGHGTAPASQTVMDVHKIITPDDPVSSGSVAKITKPDDPVATGYVFMGWFTEPECINQWDFNTAVYKSMTLYAGWGVTVSFNMNGHGTAPATQTVILGHRITEPASLTVGQVITDYGTSPSKDYLFTGWYFDSGTLDKWDFNNNTVDAQRVLYAGWADAEEYHLHNGNVERHTFADDYYLMTYKQNGEISKVCSECDYSLKVDKIKQPAGKSLYTLSINVPDEYTNSHSASFTLKGEGTAVQVSSDYNFIKINCDQTFSPNPWTIYPLRFSTADATRTVDVEQWFTATSTDPDIVFYRESAYTDNFISSDWTQHSTASDFWSAFEACLISELRSDPLKRECETFGIDFWDYDNDGKFRIVFYDFGESTLVIYPSHGFAGTAGAYYAGNTINMEGSNNSDVFFANLRYYQYYYCYLFDYYTNQHHGNTSGAAASAARECVDSLMSTLIHEYMHYLRDVVYKQRGRLPGEYPTDGHFMEEGLANYAAHKILGANEYNHITNWLSNSAVTRPSIDYWDDDAIAGSVSVSYGGGCLFFGYIENKYGFDKVKQYIHSYSSGYPNINAVTYEILGENFADVYNDFLVAFVDSIGKVGSGSFWYDITGLSDISDVIEDGNKILNNSTGASVSNLNELSFIIHKWDQCPEKIMYSGVADADGMRTYLFFK